MTTATTLTGKSIASMMRANKKTIRGLAAQMNITMVRVRYVIKNGVSGSCYVQDWIEAIQS